MPALYIYMNGLHVGEYRQSKNGRQELIYSDSWYDLQEKAIPLSLSLPMTQKNHVGDAVYNYFDNLLPDNNEIRSRLQAEFKTDTNKPFDILSAIGSDCVGAIQLLTEPETPDVKTLKGEPLTKKQIADEISKYETMPLGMTNKRDFRISIAGAQEKTALLKHQGQWMRPIGSTPTTHIIKLPIGEIKHAGIDLSDSVENEWLCLNLLREFNIPVPEVEIMALGKFKVLVVERFDRQFAKDQTWITRLPQEDMCQAHGIAPALKYENEGGPGISKIMSMLNGSQNSLEDRRLLMKSVFLFWILGAIDGHSKNFCVFLKSGGRFSLTPIYDVMSVYPITEKKQLEIHNIKMAMALRGKNSHYRWREILPRHWFSQAKRVDFPKIEMENIIEESIAQIPAAISKVSERLPKGFDQTLASAVFKNMEKAAARFN